MTHTTTAEVAAGPRASSGGVAAGVFARGSAAALVIFVASAALAYCTQLAIARIVGPDGYGQYAYVFAWMTVLAYFSALGFDVSLLRFVPAYRAQRDFGRMRGVLRYAQRMVVLAGIIVALLGASLVTVWSERLPSGLAPTFLVGFALVPIWALLWVRCSIARAFGGVISALTPERIVRDGLLLCLLGFAGPVLGWQIGAPATMGATVISSAVALFLISTAARRLQAPELTRVAPVQATGAWLLAAGPLVLIGTVEPLMNRLGVMLLGWTGDIKSAGIYAVVFNIAFLAVLPRTAVNILFAPRASELFARNDRSGLQALMLRTSVWMLAASLCIALPLWFLASPILTWFGRDFAAGAGALRILLLGQVVIAGAGSQLYLMTMTGHERSAALLVTASAAANVLVGVAFIRVLGMTGAAIATTMAFLCWNLAMGLFVWRKLGLVPGVLAGVRPKHLPGIVQISSEAR
jgi:O-antigen/teichoic acid export membrane protein